MAIIDKKFIHFKNYNDFISQAGVGSASNITTPTSGSEANHNAVYGQIKGSSIVFIKDTRQIWTHGQIYNGNAENTPNLKTVTYSELKSLRNSSGLVAGKFYRITDYKCTTTQPNTEASEHKFDLVLTALSTNTLSEEAFALPNNDDSYFDNCNLESWKIWYVLDNDTSRFVWADEVNGKGVIYRMIDEHNNDCPYDFKNITFKGVETPIFTNGGLTKKITLSQDKYYPTLCKITSAEVVDGSTLDSFKNITINPSFDSNGLQMLNGNIIITYPYSSSASVISCNITLDKGCYGNVIVNSENIHFMQGCFDNYISAYAAHKSTNILFNNGCNNNFINGRGYDITMGVGCSYNLFGNTCGCIILEDNVKGNIFGVTDTYKLFSSFTDTSFYDVSLVEASFTGNVLDVMTNIGIDMMYGTSVKYCTLKHNSRLNMIGNGAQLLSFGARSHHNVIGEYHTRIQMSDVCYNNKLYNTGYTDEGVVAPTGLISDVTFDSRSCYITIGSRTEVGDTGNIHIGKKAYSISIPVGSENVTIGSNVWHLKSDYTLKNVEIKDNNAEINLITKDGNIITDFTVESGVYENTFVSTPSFNNVTVVSNNSTHILPKNNSISYGINAKVDGKYASAFGNSVAREDYAVAFGIGTAYANGSVSGGGFYVRNYQTVYINSVTYALSSDGTHTIATCNYTHKGNTGNKDKYPCIGNGLSGCIGYITEIPDRATKEGDSCVLKFYIPTTKLTAGVPSDDKYIITTGTHYVSNASIGKSSITFGLLNSTKGIASGAIGLGLQTTNINEFAVGGYNVSTETQTLFSVGNGSTNYARSNALEVTKNGLTKITGSLSVNNYKALTEFDIATSSEILALFDTNDSPTIS